MHRLKSPAKLNNKEALHKVGGYHLRLGETMQGGGIISGEKL
jgi:hypothetical protein